MTTVLLTDGLLRKTLAAVRALGREQFQVSVGDTSLFTLAGWSKYCHQRLTYPSPKQTGNYANWLMEKLATGVYDVFLPMDDDSIATAVNIRNEIYSYTNALLPSKTNFDTMRNKQTAVEVASSVGFRVPRTQKITPENTLVAMLGSSELPVVARPVHSSGSRGLYIIDTSNIDILAPFLARLVDEDNRDWMLQSYVPVGERIDVCLIADQQSRVKASFVQRELRHYPMPYGPSTAQESIHFPELVDLCVNLVKKIGWIGVIEFEFMRNHIDGELYFMEANTRFWNSLHLAILCGVNFPKLYCDLACGRDVRDVHDYPSGRCCRSLLPLDTFYFLDSIRHRQIKQITKQCFGSADDILSLRDPGPTLALMGVSLYYACQPRMWRDVLRIDNGR